MYKSILVPVDGSPFGEQVIPAAVGLAAASGARLTLLNVWHPAWGGALASLGEPLNDVALWEAPAAGSYLSGLRSRIVDTNRVEVDVSTFAGTMTSDAILDYAKEIHADLIAMTTHGRGGFTRFWMGSVADAVLHSADCPVLMWKPTEEVVHLVFEPHLLSSRIVIPLDGSPEAEQALPHAIELGKLSNAEFLLFQAISPYRYVAGEDSWDVQVAEELEIIQHSEKYLKRLAEKMREKHPGITVHTETTIDLNPARSILRDICGPSDIVTMVSKSSRMRRLFLGSVADKVVRGCEGPILLVRAKPLLY